MSQLLGTEVSAIQRCPLFRGFHIRFCINSCRSKKMCPLFGGVRYQHLRYCGLLLYTPLKFPSNCRLLSLKPFTLLEVFPYVYLFRLIHDIQSLIVMLNNLSYIHHFVGIFEKNQHSFHDDNNNELLDAIISVFVYIFHNLETSSKNYPSLTVN